MSSPSLRKFLGALLFPLILISSAQAQEQDNKAEFLFWETVTATDKPEMYQSYLDAFPNGIFRPLAEIKLSSLTEERTAQENAAMEACDRLAGHRLDET